MNKLTLNAAVKRFTPLIKGLKEAEIKEMINMDGKEFTPEEVDEIYNAICAQFADPKKEVKIGFNNEIDLSFLEYENLKAIDVEEDGEKFLAPSDTFKKYKEIESKLIDRKTYTFLKFRAKANVERGFSRKTGVPIVKLVGIELVNSKPVNETQVEYRHIKDLNAQIMDLNNRPENSVYYILKK
jgi:hypothetical protein